METVGIYETLFSNKNSYVCRAIYQNENVILKVVQNTNRNKLEYKLLKMMRNTNTTVEVKRQWYDCVYIYIILEQCNGDLLDYCVLNKTLTLTQSLNMLVDVVKCLIELKKLGYAHRDVSLENILIKGDKYLLCDFGLSESFKKTKQNDKKFFPVGKRSYIAPELFDHRLQSDNYDLSKADVYALGVCFYNVITGQQFYINHQYKYQYSVIKTLKNDKRLQNIPRNTRNLLLHMLRSCPEQRCDLQFILKSASQL